jgi:hypothetical protein
VEHHLQLTLPLAVGQGFENQGLEHLQDVGDPPLELAEAEMERIAADPSRALDPSLDIFAPVAAAVPESKEYQTELLDEEATAADEKTEYFINQEVLKVVRTPPAKSGEELAKPFMLKVIKVQAVRALEKLHDKRLALANKLASQNGDYAMRKNADGHQRITSARCGLQHNQRCRREQVCYGRLCHALLPPHLSAQRVRHCRAAPRACL